MIILRSFNDDDISTLKKNIFTDKSSEEIYSVLKEWNTFTFNGKYFEMLAIVEDDNVVGSVSLYQHNDYIISAGPEIFSEYRRNGYAYKAMKQACEYAKKQGYKIATAQIRKNNTASIRLHEKLGFVLDCELINKQGNEIYIYIKLL
ncbi:MAG: GNAT family N-acetyltransferase [Clostridia bacterium]|nr:GNAT family N-acetyltransferase [Clostridia bacterium]